MLYVDPPFELGETLDGTDSSSNLINKSWLGQRFFHPAQRLTGGIRASKTRYTGKGIWAIALRNVSGAVLYSKRLVQLGTGADSTHEALGFETVTGYAITLADGPCVIVDPFLASGTTVADNDIFWGVLTGRCTVKCPTVNSAFNGDIAAGAPLVSATLNTTTGNTTAGCVANVTLPGQTGATQAFSMAANIIGYAVSARTTNETGGVDLLIDACIRY